MKFFKHLGQHFEEYACGATLFVMTSLTFANVVSRYWLHASIAFTDEITTALFVLLSTVGTAMAVKRNAHLGLSALYDVLGPHKQALLSVIANVLGILFSIVMIYTGCKMVNNQIVNRAITISLQWPAAIYGSFIPIGLSLTAFRFAQNALKALDEYKKTTPQGV